MAIVLLNTWLAASALQTLLNSQKWLEHSYEVLDNTRRLVANVRAAESAARGYILTASPAFEQQFNNVSRGVNDSLTHMDSLVADNPNQHQRVGVLRLRIAAKMEVLQDGIAVRHGHPTGTIDPSLLGAVVQDTPDKVESVQVSIHDIQADELRLLAERAGQAESARRQVKFTFGIAFLLDFLLLVAAYELLARIGRDRERIAANAEQIQALNSELQASNMELEDRVAERTRELADARLRHETETELRVAQQRFSSTFNQAAVGMAQTSVDGHFLLANQRLAEQLGMPVEALLSLSLWDFALPSERHLDDVPFAALTAGAEPGYCVERTLMRGDGSTFPAQLTVSLLRHESVASGDPESSVLWVVEDITARKAAERKTAELMTRLINSERLAAAGRMANTLAHEINNPLEALTNIVFLMQDQNLSPQAQELMAIASRELDRVGHITRSTLSFYRKVPGRTLDLHTLLKEVVQLFQTRATQQRVEILTRYGPDICKVHYDPSLRQVFANIVGNALEAMEGVGGRILLRARRCEDCVVVTVSDTGHGIDADNLASIFEPFFTTKGERGTGLGLWVTRGIVEEQGGKLHLRSRNSGRHRGTTIRITLPAPA
jgi:PAS domain S-box-containing protein